MADVIWGLLLPLWAASGGVVDMTWGLLLPLWAASGGDPDSNLELGRQVADAKSRISASRIASLDEFWNSSEMSRTNRHLLENGQNCQNHSE